MRPSTPSAVTIHRLNGSTEEDRTWRMLARKQLGLADVGSEWLPVAFHHGVVGAIRMHDDGTPLEWALAHVDSQVAE